MADPPPRRSLASVLRSGFSRALGGLVPGFSQSPTIDRRSTEGTLRGATRRTPPQPPGALQQDEETLEESLLALSRHYDDLGDFEEGGTQSSPRLSRSSADSRPASPFGLRPERPRPPVQLTVEACRAFEARRMSYRECRIARPTFRLCRCGPTLYSALLPLVNGQPDDDFLLRHVLEFLPFGDVARGFLPSSWPFYITFLRCGPDLTFPSARIHVSLKSWNRVPEVYDYLAHFRIISLRGLEVTTQLLTASIPRTMLLVEMNRLWLERLTFQVLRIASAPKRRGDSATTVARPTQRKRRKVSGGLFGSRRRQAQAAAARQAEAEAAAEAERQRQLSALDFDLPRFFDLPELRRLKVVHSFADFHVLTPKLRSLAFSGTHKTTRWLQEQPAFPSELSKVSITNFKFPKKGTSSNSNSSSDDVVVSCRKMFNVIGSNPNLKSLTFNCDPYVDLEIEGVQQLARSVEELTMRIPWENINDEGTVVRNCYRVIRPFINWNPKRGNVGSNDPINPVLKVLKLDLYSCMSPSIFRHVLAGLVLLPSLRVLHLDFVHDHGFVEHHFIPEGFNRPIPPLEELRLAFGKNRLSMSCLRRLKLIFGLPSISKLFFGTIECEDVEIVDFIRESLVEVESRCLELHLLFSKRYQLEYQTMVFALTNLLKECTSLKYVKFLAAELLDKPLRSRFKARIEDFGELLGIAEELLEEFEFFPIPSSSERIRRARYARLIDELNGGVDVDEEEGEEYVIEEELEEEEQGEEEYSFDLEL